MTSSTPYNLPAGNTPRPAIWADVPDEQWNDWRWQMSHRITTYEEFSRVIHLTPEETEGLKAENKFRTEITPYFASLIDPDDPECPVRQQVVPHSRELAGFEAMMRDSLGEESHSPVPGLVHRYPDRVLLLVTDFCSTYCRYCTRSRIVGQGELSPSRERLEAAFDYIRRSPQVRDVLISGGDPLTLSDEKLEWILSSLRAIPHVEIIRMGSKIPAVLPQRVTPQLARMLRKYHPLWMSLHFTHPDECCYETERACNMLADAGIPLGSQTVLLKGVNDNVQTMKSLMHEVMKMRVRPYYVYQCDPIHGSGHFRTPVSKGLEIIRGLRGHTTGYAVPTYVIDAPGGGGKIPITPDFVMGKEGNDLLLGNYEGKTFKYPDYIAE